MKRFLYIIFTLLLVSCEKEIGKLTDFEMPRLVVNALITAQDDSQQIRVRVTGLYHAEKVDGADVTLMLNGKEIYSHTTSSEDSLVISTKDFKVGDEVKVDVWKDAMHATASAKVLPPLQIVGMDTLTVMAKRFTTSRDLEPHTQLQVKLRLADGIEPKETYYYRVSVYKNVYTLFSWSLDGEGFVDAVSYRTENDHNSFSYASDAALSESEGVNQENMSVSFDWLEGVKNTYHVFRSNYFENGEYTLRLDFPAPFSGSQNGWSQDINVKVYAISRTEYNYLMALSAYKNLDHGTIYDTEPGITTNVVGGAGIFCVESVDSISFHDDHKIIKVGDNYYHRNDE